MYSDIIAWQAIKKIFLLFFLFEQSRKELCPYKI